jgi:lipopolysaccharide/colanic/teichoic acid biosynthesis glycosyltransferase
LVDSTSDVGIGARPNLRERRLVRNYAVAWPSAGDPSIENCSGLPLTLQGGAPAPPSCSALRSLQLGAKTVTDRVLALALLLILGLPLLAIAMAVKLTSPGPVFFYQLRDGFEGRCFRLLKFRTMRVERCDASGAVQTAVDDPRVTPLGRFLRRSNLDEFPQLLNVLRGDMSLVGPRPHPCQMRVAGVRYDELVPHYAARHAMKPGITGWAQCNGLRGAVDDAASAAARIKHDLAYIQNFSLLLDVRALWRTVHREIGGGTGI